MIALKKRMVILFLAGLLALLQCSLPALGESVQENKLSVAVESYHDRTYVFRMTVPGLKASYSVNAPETPMNQSDFDCAFQVRSGSTQYRISVMHFKDSDTPQEVTPESMKAGLSLVGTASMRRIAPVTVTVQQSDLLLEVVFPNDFNLTKARITSAVISAKDQSARATLNVHLPYDEESVNSFTGGSESDDRILAGVSFGTVSADGFIIPRPDSGRWHARNNSGVLFYDEYRDETKHVYVSACLYQINDSVPGGYAEDPEAAKKMLADSFSEETYSSALDFDYEFFEIDGHPAFIDRVAKAENRKVSHLGRLFYPRNNIMLSLIIGSLPVESGSTPWVTMEDLHLLADMIGYNEDEGPLTRKSAEITLSAPGNPSGITAGNTLKFSATFADPAQVNSKAKNDDIVWSAMNAETGETIPSVTISDTGLLRADSSPDAPVDVIIKAVSPIFGTEAAYRLTVMPVIRAITVEPAELILYAGTDAALTARAILDPPIIPQGVTWIPNRAGIVEITDTGNGTVSIRPLAAGKTGIDVTEPGGLKTILNVSIVEPVTALELSAKGKAKPGGTVTVQAALTPKKPGNKTVEWSLDVGEDIAAINAKGQIKISKNAVPGTKITITCRALGAPEPITATLLITVIEK